jgi:hypothetical protein
MSADSRIGSSEFGEYHYEEFLKWSFGDRKSKAALLRDVAVARTDANKDLIDRKIEFYADLYGLSVEELIDRIREADDRKTSIPKLHEQLAQEAGLTISQTKEFSD